MRRGNALFLRRFDGDIHQNFEFRFLLDHIAFCLWSQKQVRSLIPVILIPKDANMKWKKKPESSIINKKLIPTENSLGWECKKKTSESEYKNLLPIRQATQTH
ncbi:hypothetical protein CEXT_761151 [Caerostris extrusa]|uniref:Uncharacterized protein n=1 Tax=Caerostris extrusa TaxID=172846 RepID=A0AAV4R3T2_CAEEX|nr:hypothetical protein CEXT_761151 [Caerostris extrusa]